MNNLFIFCPFFVLKNNEEGSELEGTSDTYLLEIS